MKTAFLMPHWAMFVLCIGMSSAGIASSADKAGKSDPKQVKEQVTTGLNMAVFAKLSVSEQYMVDGKWPNNNDEAKVAPVIDTDFSIKVGVNGVVTILFLDLPELAGKSITLIPSAVDGSTVNWACKSLDIPVEYLPKKCQ